MRPRLVLFTDLDGTLLDPQTYQCDEARPGVEELRARNIPLILCTSKTRAEVEPIRTDLNNSQPFIVENGGALYIPDGYFKALPPGSEYRHGYYVIAFGVPYSRLREALRTIEAHIGTALVGFSDMTVEEIMQATGLAQHGAERARQRDYDEPFLISDSHTPLATIRQEAAKLGLTILAGGRFLHLIGGTDKGQACRVLIELYRKEWGAVFTAGIGDSLNDLPMLQCVDRPFLVEQPEGGYAPGMDVEGLTRLQGSGPAGWVGCVRHLLQEPPPPSAT